MAERELRWKNNFADCFLFGFWRIRALHSQHMMHSKCWKAKQRKKGERPWKPSIHYWNMRSKRFCFHGNGSYGASAGAIYHRKRTFTVRDAGKAKDNYRDPFPQLGAFVNILLDVCAQMLHNPQKWVSLMTPMSELLGMCRWLSQAKCLWGFGCTVGFGPSTMLLWCMNTAWGANRNLRVKILLGCRFWIMKLQFSSKIRGLCSHLSPPVAHIRIHQGWGALWQLFCHSSTAWNNSREKGNMKQERELKRYRRYWYKKNWNRTPSIAFILLQRASLDHHLLKMISSNTNWNCLWYGDAQKLKKRLLYML